MNLHAQILLTFGCILLLGIATDVIGRRTALPRVTLMLIFGALIGEEVLDLIPSVFADHFELIAQIVLVIIGFILGSKFTLESLHRSKKLILFSSLGAALGTSIIVTSGLLLVRVPFEIAILLGCIASATAPAATLDVIREAEFNTPFSKLLLSVVALDDAWGLIIFSIGLAIVASLRSTQFEMSPFIILLIELGGAVILGAILGYFASLIPKFIHRASAIYTASFGLILICGGFAIWWHLSYLIASMMMGAVVTNIFKEHQQYFQTLENIQWPFLVIFFTVAGATLDFSTLNEISMLGLAYILFRVIGKIISGYIGSRLGQADSLTSRWLGVALLPQAGVAIGMALVAASQFPEHKQILLSIVISTTILFEIIGPIFTRLAIYKARVT